VEPVVSRRIVDAGDAPRPTRRRFSEWGNWLLACVESLADPVVVTDEEGVIVFASSQVESLLGYERSDLVGKKVERFLPERYRRAHVEHRRGYRSAPRPRIMGSGVELAARRRDGTEIPVEVSLSRVETAEGTVVVSAIRDLSERLGERRRREARRAELVMQVARLRRLSALGALAAGLGHELNNALQSIYGFGAIALEDAAEPEVRAHIEKTLAAAARGSRLVGQLLAFGQTLRARRRPLRLEVVVARALELLRPTTPSRVALRFVTETAPAPVRADPDLIQEVVIQLVLNAREAVAPEGTIELSLREAHAEEELETPHVRLPAGSYVCLRVRDTGRGLEQSELARRLDPGLVPERGQGLGLALVHGLVRQHEGALFGESRPERGTSFEVWLPVAGGELS
jgi:PAS domain S-box-containing protein